MKVIAALLLTVPFAAAECPNACSSHGECGMYDSCECHDGFQGGDCSERVCMYNFAWVTTSNGDVNFDGDRYDGTVYSADIRISANQPLDSINLGGSKLTTQAAPGGTWENWPYYAAQQEGHFYMECSNRGLCKRDTGDCECFPGYEGVACNRMVCPDNCNGKGVCQTVKDFSSSYAFWDGDMARSCKCDPGYTGISCAERQCPFSNDVLTKTNEVYETQYIEIFSNCELASGGLDCSSGDIAYGASSTMLDGTFTLTYTDHFGQAYTTVPINLDIGSLFSSSTVAGEAQDALRALPNDVTSDTLTVSASTCGYADDAQVTMVDTGDLSGDAAWAAGETFGIAASSVTDIYTIAAGGAVRKVTAAGTQAEVLTSGLGTAATQTYRYTYPICVRLKVDFVDMPGDLNLLTVDHSLATYDGFTNAMYSPLADHIGSSVTSALTVTGSQAAANTNAAHIGYKNPSTVTVSTSDAVTASTTGKVLTYSADTFMDVLDNVHTFYPGSVVEVSCTEAAGLRSLGYYTIASLTKTAATFVETIQTSECDTANSAYTAAKIMVTTQISNVIAFGNTGYTDPASGTATTEAATVPDITKVYEMSAGQRIGIRLASDSSTYQFDSTVGSTHFAQITSDGAISTVSRSWIILADDSTKFLGALKLTSAGVMTRNQYLAAGAAQIYIDGDGTMENSECGDRGLCDTDTGLCKCFTGYTGDACQLQKAIAA